MPRLGKHLGLWSALGSVALLVGCQTANVGGLPTSQPSLQRATGLKFPGYRVQDVVTTGGAVNYMVTGASAAAIAQAGGQVPSTLDGMGIAFATSSDPGFASKVKAAGASAVAAVHRRSMEQGIKGHRWFLEPDKPNYDGPGHQPYSGYQWGLKTTNVEGAWQRGAQGQGVKVAVLDTGADDHNENLRPNLDWDEAKSFIASESTATDLNGHGSHVAGLIAAAANDTGTIGVAPDATILPVKVLDDTGYGDDAGILAGMQYAADHHAKVINMSLEGFATGPDEIALYQLAIDYCNGKGAIVVTATGNDGMDPNQNGVFLLPQQCKGVIAVSGVGPLNQQNFDTFSNFSNFGNFVSLAAPAGNVGFDANFNPILYTKLDFVLSTWSTKAVQWSQGGLTFGPAKHMFLAGTSMAAPHVAGALALEYSLHPTWTPDQAKSHLLKSADHVAGPGWNAQYGSGRLNCGNAVL